MTTSYTVTYLLPYPEGNEYVIGGDDAIQALAERLDALLTPSSVNAEEYAGTLQNAAGGAGVTVAYDAPLVSMTADWSHAAGVFTYSGAARPFVITGNVSVHGRPDTQHIVDLYVGGVRRRRSEFMDASTAGAFAGWASHAYAWTGTLGPGATVSVTAIDGSSASLWYPSLSIVSTGPRQ